MCVDCISCSYGFLCGCYIDLCHLDANVIIKNINFETSGISVFGKHEGSMKEHKNKKTKSIREKICGL